MCIQYICFEIQVLNSITNSFSELIQIFTHHLLNMCSYFLPDASIWSPEVGKGKKKKSKNIIVLDKFKFT